MMGSVDQLKKYLQSCIDLLGVEVIEYPNGANCTVVVPQTALARVRGLADLLNVNIVAISLLSCLRCLLPLYLPLRTRGHCRDRPLMPMACLRICCSFCGYQRLGRRGRTW